MVKRMTTIGSLPPQLCRMPKFPKIRKFWKTKEKISNFRMLRSFYRLFAFIKLSYSLMIVYFNPFSRLFLSRFIYDIWIEAKKMLMNEETQFSDVFLPGESDEEEVRILFVRLFH